MKKSSVILVILLPVVIAENISAQQLFKDSDQSLGHNNSFSVKLGDLDGDGDLDAAVANPTSFIRGEMIYQNNEIWLNDGKGIFTKTKQQLGSSSKLTLFDIDRDDDLDLIEDGFNAFRGPGGSYDRTPIRVWFNDGNANFTPSDKYSFEGIEIAFDNILNDDDQYEAISLESTGITANDSTILRIYSIDQSSCRLKNEITFKNFIERGLATGDLNNDGYCDLVIYRAESNYILFNDKRSGFLKSDQELPGVNHTMSVLIDDLNGDGFSDILQVNYHGMPGGPIPSKLYLNDGSGHFKETPLVYDSSILTSSAAISDFNNDGYPDIFINHGHQFLFQSNISEILINDGNANFTSIPALENIQSIYAAPGDLDNDGDPDLFLTCVAVDGSPVSNRIWFNTAIDTKPQ